VFCSTNACTLQRAQLGHAQRTIATLRWERDALTAQVATLAAQLADVRRDLAAERAAKNDYLQMFADEKRRMR